MVRSVGAKLFTMMLVILLLTFGLLGFANVRLHRQHLDAARLAYAERMTDVIRRSTAYDMLRNDRAALRQMLETIGQQPMITRLRIYDAEGAIKFSTDAGEVGKRVDRALIPASGNRIVTRRGERNLDIIQPIANAPSCATAACHAHSPATAVLGTLDAHLSLATTDSDIRVATWQFIGYAAIGIVVTVATTAFFVLRIVRKLDRRVRGKTAELQTAHEQMLQAEKLTSLGRLAAVVAHEINNPLSGILTYAKLLRRWVDRGELEGRAQEMRESLQLIESESRRCGDIVRNLLTFARVAPLNITAVDCNDVIHQTIRLVQHKLDLGNIALRLELAADLPAIRGDAAQLEQLLLALVINAIEAMPREGTLFVATAPRDDRSNVVITVSDDGIGIPPTILSRLFDPFVTTKEEGKGVGLGLAISRTIVERHHGRIEVASEVGRGTTFTITFPAVAMEAAA